MIGISNRRWRGTATVVALLGLACGGPDLDSRAGIGVEVAAGGGDLQVLVFTRTTGFRHGSIADGIAAVEQLGLQRGWTVDATEDPARFDDTLAQFDVVVFLNTTGDILDDTQQAAMETYIRGGGGFVGVHSATDTEYGWPWYGELVGAYFAGHPAPQDATVTVVDPSHPATMHLPMQWMRFDEWYDFQTDPSGSVDVLLNLDESTYSGGSMGPSHPIAWSHAFDGGRAFYTAGGHTSESFSEPDFVAHLAAGIVWAAGDAAPGGTTGGAPGSTGDSVTDGPGSTGGDGPGPSPTTGAADGGGNGDAGVSATAGENDEDADGGGCRLGSPRTPTRPGGWLALLGLAALRRRR